MQIQNAQPTPQPVRIDKASDNSIRITWTNLQRFELPFFELRAECPCAACVDEWTGERTLQRESLPADVRPLEISPVGRYAIRILWSDGHGTGMYGFDRLHTLCAEKGRLLPRPQ